MAAKAEARADESISRSSGVERGSGSKAQAGAASASTAAATRVRATVNNPTDA